MRLAVLLLRALDRADIERGMGPGRLGQIFDDAGNAVVAFDEQDVARLDDAAQLFRIAGCKRLIARHLLLKVAGNKVADHVEHDAHDINSPRRPLRLLFPSLIMHDSRCNLVHAWLTSIMIDSPWRLPALAECGKFAT